MSDGGKGSKPRPYSITQNEFADNWDRIFSKKNEKASSEADQVDQSSKPGELVVPGLQQDTFCRRN